MKLIRIGIVVLTGCVALAGMAFVKYGRPAEDVDREPVLLESCFIPVDGEDEIAGELVEALDHNPGIFFEGTLLPYDRESNRLYLPQGCGEGEWYGEMTAEIGGKNRPLYMPRGDMALMSEGEKRMEAVREGYGFAVYVQVGRGKYCRFLLTVTGMPLISMETRYEKEAGAVPEDADPDKRFFGSGTKYYGKFLMLDPGVRGGQYRITEAAVCYHYKGASTAWFEKKSYSLELLDTRGGKAEASLAGMRSDSSWKLNALYTDGNRIREITASRIWEMIDRADGEADEPGPDMEYVELVVDDEYRGVYCLVEPVDAKKLGLQETDVLYKVVDWEIPDSESIRESADKGWKAQLPSIRIRFPKEIRDYQAAWYPMDDYLEKFYRGDIVPYEEAAVHIDLDNFCDMLIFTMAVSGSDNFFKNTYYAAECVDGVQNYRMKQIPWDLDYTFGNVYRYGTSRGVGFDDDFRKEYAEDALFRLYEDCPEGVVPRLQERWEEYRGGFLATDSIVGLLQENRDYLLDTGAYIREGERWPQGEVSPDIDGLKEFQSRRMEWLDDYFAAWPVYDRGSEPCGGAVMRRFVNERTHAGEE